MIPTTSLMFLSLFGLSFVLTTVFLMARKQSKWQRKQFEESMRQRNEAERGKRQDPAIPFWPKAFAPALVQPEDENKYFYCVDNDNDMALANDWSGQTFHNQGQQRVGRADKSVQRETRVSLPMKKENGQVAKAFYSPDERRVYVTYSLVNGGYANKPEIVLENVGPDERVLIVFEGDRDAQRRAQAQAMASSNGMYMYLSSWGGFENYEVIEGYAHRFEAWRPNFPAV